MQITTMRFGAPEQIEVPESRVYEFYPGLNGFEQEHRYALLIDDDSAVEWLQSLATPGICFPLLDPNLFAAGYAFELPDADAQALGAERAEDVAVRVVLTLRDPLQLSSANLLAPVILSPKTQLGRQLLLQEAEYPLRYPVFEGLQLEAPDAPAIETARGARAA